MIYFPQKQTPFIIICWPVLFLPRHPYFSFCNFILLQSVPSLQYVPCSTFNKDRIWSILIQPISISALSFITSTIANSKIELFYQANDKCASGLHRTDAID